MGKDLIGLAEILEHIAGHIIAASQDQVTLPDAVDGGIHLFPSSGQLVSGHGDGFRALLLVPAGAEGQQKQEGVGDEIFHAL